MKKVSPFTLSSLLRIEKDPSLSLKLFNNPNPTQNSQFKHTLLSYDLIISKLGRAKMFDELETILLQLKHEKRFSPTEIIFCNVITYYGRAKLPNCAFRVFKSIPDFGCKRTVKSLNSLLNALLKCEEFDQMSVILMGIDKLVDPDECTFNIWINMCCSKGDLEGASKVFDEMLKRGLNPNAITFGTLIRGFCVNGKLGEAMRLKRDMVRKFVVKPGLIVYTTLIKGLCDAKEIDKALKLKEEMLRNGIKLDSSVYTTFISAFFKVGNREDALEVLKEMRENGCKPDTPTYNALIFGYCMERDFQAAYGVLDQMVENGCKPDIFSYNVIMGGLGKDGKYREANDLFLDMPRRGCVPDVVSYRIIFDHLCEGKQFKEAAFILSEMIFKGYAPRVASLNKFVDGLCREGNVELLWTVMKSLIQGSVVDIETWRVAISMICKKDHFLDPGQHFDALIMPSSRVDTNKIC